MIEKKEILRPEDTKNTNHLYYKKNKIKKKKINLKKFDPNMNYINL
jgi:hypothetical protein